MARLNQPPSATIESIESLKRRFIRQNRELARCNSTQSIKIRTLEDEVAKLLGENISLRESNIELHKELEEWSSEGFVPPECIHSLKLELEVQLRNLTSELMTQVDSLRLKPIPRKKQGDRSRIRTISTLDYINKQHKNRDRLSEVLASQGCMLPTIVEGKSYPRATLDANELQSIFFDQSNDVNDAVGRPTSETSPVDPQHADLGEGRDSRAPLILPQVNLETRRHRRESGVKIEPLGTSKTSPSKELGISGQPLRAGSKRKLDDRVIEPTCKSEVLPTEALPTSEPQPADSESYKDIRYGNRRLDDATSRLRQATSPARKALAPKSINTDPVVTSPVKRAQGRKPGIRKASREVSDMCSAEEKFPPDIAKVDESNRPKTTKKPFISTPKTIDVKVEPITPGPDLELLSPPSTAHNSGIRDNVARNGTPPPMGLASQEHSEFGPSRSRRARTAVSYAEPSLNTKMRRPGKELVDAIYPKGHRQSTGTSFEIGAESKEELSAEGQSSEARKTLLYKNFGSEPGQTDIRSLHFNDLKQANGSVQDRRGSSEQPAEGNVSNEINSSDTHLRSWIDSASEGEHPTTASSLLSRPKEGRVNRRLSTLKPSEHGEQPLDGQVENVGIYDVTVTPPASAFKAVSSNSSGSPESESSRQSKLTVAAIAEDKKKQQQRSQIGSATRPKSSTSLNAAANVSTSRSTSGPSSRRQTLANDNGAISGTHKEPKHVRSSSTSALSMNTSSRRTVGKVGRDDGDGVEDSPPMTTLSNTTTRRRRTMIV